MEGKQWLKQMFEIKFKTKIFHYSQTLFRFSTYISTILIGTKPAESKGSNNFNAYCTAVLNKGNYLWLYFKLKNELVFYKPIADN